MRGGSLYVNGGTMTFSDTVLRDATGDIVVGSGGTRNLS